MSWLPPSKPVAILFFVTQQLARLSIDEVQSGTGWATYRVVLVISRRLLLINWVQPVMHVAISLRTGEDNMSHATLIGIRMLATLI